jgi:hypothetical protein
MIEKKQIIYNLLRDGQILTRYAISKNFDIDIKRKKIIDKRDNSEKEYNIDTKILIYEDRQNAWFFDIANRLKKDNEAGFVILMIASSYIESNQQYIEGRTSKNRESELFFNKALDRIFPELGVIQKELLYREMRCGFFHDGMTRKAIFITGDQKKVFKTNGENLIINPYLFLDKIISDFKSYINKLHNPSDVDSRMKFEKFWDGFKGI